MDELKKYLQQNAAEMDVDTPRPQVWENIERATATPKKPATIIAFTRWAAAACILVLAGIGTWHVIADQQPTPSTQVAQTVKPQLTPAQKETVTPAIKEAIEEPVTAKTENRHPNKQKPNKPINQKPTNTAADIAALTNIENSFTQVINLQRARVSNTPMFAETPEYFNDFRIQIKQIEKDEKVIKSDIAKRGMNDELLDQLINLYQQKLNTLKQLQIEMNKTNNKFKQNRGPVDSARTYFLNI